MSDRVHREMTPDNEVAFRGLSRTLESAGKSARTIIDYHTGCLSLQDYLAWAGRPLMLLGVTRDDILGWLIELRHAGGWSVRKGELARLGRPLAKASIRSYFAFVHRFYSYAVAEGLIDADPMAGMEMPPKNTKPRAIPDTEIVRAMIATCNPKARKRSYADVRDEFLIRLLAETGGPRIGEVASLPTERLDLQHDIVLINGKGDKWRTIPLSATTAQAAQRYVTRRIQHRDACRPQLLLGARGPMTESGVYWAVCERARLAGARVHPHQLRHYAADKAKYAGMSDSDLMILFGWETAEMLRNYGKAHEAERAIAASRRHRLGDQL